MEIRLGNLTVKEIEDMKKNKIQWFRNVFVPNAGDDTIFMQLKEANND